MAIDYFDLATLTGKTAPDVIERLRDALSLVHRLPGCADYDIEQSGNNRKHYLLVERTGILDAWLPVSDPMTLSELSRFVTGFYAGLAAGFDKGAK